MASTDYFFTTKTVITDTKISIDTGDNLTYDELVNDLSNNPYYFSSASIFANTISQVSQKINRLKKTANGIVFEDLRFPRVSPEQKQFVINGIDIDFAPSPINRLKYKVLANQSVSLWFFYTNKDKFDIKEIETKEVQEVQKLKIEKEMKGKIEVVAPMVKLVNDKLNSKKRTIKELVSKGIKLRDNEEISNEEVFNSFDGSDFKEIQ